MALIGLIDLDEPLEGRAEAALHRALREAGVSRVVGPDDGARLDRGDRVLLIGADTLLDSAMITAMAEGVTATLACLPNELDTARYELIDGTTRWAGWAALPGDVVAETAQGLAPEWSLSSTLVRRAVQAGALRVDAARPGALIPLDAPDAVAAIDLGRLRAAMRPRSGVSGRIIEHAALLVATELLPVTHNVRWAAGATALGVAAYGGSLAYGWLAPAALSLILIVVAARVWRGLAAVAGRPLPWLNRASDALAIIGLAVATYWTWTWSDQWGVIALAVVLAADTVMASEDEESLGEPLKWRADAPAYATLFMTGALVGQPIPALVAATAYASISFAVVRRRLRAKLQRASTPT